MNTDDIVFGKEVGYDASRQAVAFTADIGGKRVMCFISQIALNDYFGTPDTKEQVLENFQNHKDGIFALAERFISKDRFNENGEIYIVGDDCREYGLES